MNKGRLEAFSDGIFAIAITLLVLTIANPTNYHHLTAQLGHRWPSLAAYVVSFLIIGIEWLNHHTVCAHLERVDRTFFYLNLFLLMTVAFLPYPTGVFGEALQKGDATQAAVFYSIVVAFNAVIWSITWLYVTTGRRLLSPKFPESARKMSMIAFSLGPIPYGIAIGLAFVSPYASLAFQGALAFYYAFDPIARRVEQAQSG